MEKATAMTIEKLLAQRKAIDLKIAKLKAEEKEEKRTAILKAIMASGLAELQDMELKKALESLKTMQAATN